MGVSAEDPTELLDEELKQLVNADIDLKRKIALLTEALIRLHTEKQGAEARLGRLRDHYEAEIEGIFRHAAHSIQRCKAQGPRAADKKALLAEVERIKAEAAQAQRRVEEAADARAQECERRVLEMQATLARLCDRAEGALVPRESRSIEALQADHRAEVQRLNERSAALQRDADLRRESEVLASERRLKAELAAQEARWRADLDGAAAAAESKLKGEFAYAENEWARERAAMQAELDAKQQQLDVASLEEGDSNRHRASLQGQLTEMARALDSMKEQLANAQVEVTNTHREQMRAEEELRSLRRRFADGSGGVGDGWDVAHRNEQVALSWQLRAEELADRLRDAGIDPG